MSAATRDCLVTREVQEHGLSRQAQIETGVVRRTTAEALELIALSETQTLSHGVWYEPELDSCFYAAAHDACRATKIRLKALKLDDGELASIDSARGLDVLLQQIQETTKAQEKASKGHPVVKKAGQFVKAFSEFVTRSSGIIELLVPQSPEYRMTYGAFLLVFKTVFKRQETQESLLVHIENLSSKLPLIDFYSTLFPTNRVKTSVVSIYVEILHLLDEAIVYYQKNHLRQLRDAVLRPVETKFDKCVHRIENEIDKLMDLKEAGLAAKQAEIKERLESTGQVVARLHENLNQSMAAFSTGFSLLDARIERISQQSSTMHKFQAVSHSLALVEILLPTASTAHEQFSIVRKQHFDLSPKDHWYENGVLRAFQNWSTYGRIELLWIGGSSGNQDTWVTEMSIHLIDALTTQELTLLHVFCGISGEQITATSLIKRLIAQLVECHPDIPFRQPEKYNARAFRRATSFKKLWVIFETLISEITSSVFILIDSIENCAASPNEDEGGCTGLIQDLLPYLMGLSNDAEHVSIIVTSEYGPPEALIGEEDLMYFYLDTRKSRGRREG
ncbi:hypothetical protein DE146DRAFT_112847 [Phaeosphaeria sp. MPI-PUGE-AT-0046c]|nr:hypothetical protein DE146DRAFT_112847 [Phaeosphaeria sp. MPI-PUGE-AT-0046c]